MADFNDHIKRMQDLMNYNSLNEDTNKLGRNIEYCTVGADDKIYGIIRENNKFYIKTTSKGLENVTESYEYIGGFCNRKDHEYSSYTNAIKQLEMKLMSLNESLCKHLNVEVLDPDKKEFLAIEGTEKMKNEIARQREIMMNSSAILNEDSHIGMKNTGVPEAPKTTSFNASIGEPFNDKATAKLDKDLTDKATDPKAQGDPFDEKCCCGNMTSDKAPKCNKKDEYEKAKYVPDNSVADKSPKSKFSAKMNEDCDEWGSCGLPDDSNAGVGKSIPDVMGEGENNDIVGQEDEVMPDNEMMPDDNVMPDDDVMSDNEMVSDDDVMSDDEMMSGDNVMPDDEMASDDDVMSDEEFERLLRSATMPQESNTFESKKAALVNTIVETITNKILKEDKAKSKRGNGVGILLPKWFNDKAHYLAPFYNNYSKLVGALKNIKMSEDANEVDNIYRNAERVYLKLKKVIKGLQNGLKLNMHDDEYSKLKQIIDSTSPEDINTLLMSIDDVWEQVCNAWDDKYAKEVDKDFNIKNNRWNYHKVNDLGYSEFDNNDLDAVQRRDSDYEMEGLDRNIKEDKTVLHDFGKHPGYRKKPMTLPSNSDDIKDGYKDWNDDSVKGEKPFGLKIGSSAPFDEKVKMITDAVMDQLKEIYSKKKS